MANKISNRSYLKSFLLIILLTASFCYSRTQPLNGFTLIPTFPEQEITITGKPADVSICINAPLHFNKKGKTCLVIFALPNGNSIEWTKGKKTRAGDDWHFDIQHIAAQTRFVRTVDKKNNYIIAYVMTGQKSWPAWKRNTENAKAKIKALVDSLAGVFKDYDPEIILNGHSGGGSFIFGYLDAVDHVPDNIRRIAFLDSDYGYEDSLHTNKLVSWLQRNKRNNLFVLAYNDSIVIYNGKPLVNPAGGTWYRSRLMHAKLSGYFSFKTSEDTSFISHTALNGRVRIILKHNPAGLIYHTVQVEKNGFIYSLLSYTKFDRRNYFTYWGDRVYEKYISD